MILSYISDTGIFEKDNVIKPFLLFLKTECPPVLILHEFLKCFCLSKMKSGSSSKNIIKIDLWKMLVLGTTKVLKKLNMLLGPDVCNFRKKFVRRFRMEITEKLKECSPMKYFLPLYLGCFYHQLFKHSVQNVS